MLPILITHFAETCDGSSVTTTVGSNPYSTGLHAVCAGPGELQQILQIAFGIAAALAILFIVIAGLRFVTGSNSPQEVAKARDTIIYALVGLLVAVTAEAIVTFALGSL